MKSVKLKYSKSQIDKAGETLKGNSLKDEIDQSLEILSNWRSYHAMPLDTFAKVLRERVGKISGLDNTIVAQRLKRTPSILLKLKKHKTMRLSTMQDIGGLRAVFNDIRNVDSLVDLYVKSKSRHTLFAVHDYISNPKKDGYRSVHLVYKLNRTPAIFIEIQVRSYLQHIWATGVEVFGTLKNSSFKSGYGSREWLDFFSLLSSVFAVKENSPTVDVHKSFTKKQLLTKVSKMIQKLKVIEQLSVYTTLYKITLGEHKNGRRGHYSLVLLNSHDNTISVKTFSSGKIEDATNLYLEMEKKYFNDININVVLVNSGDIQKLEASYPNYFMDTKVLVENLSKIVIGSFLGN